MSVLRYRIRQQLKKVRVSERSRDLVVFSMFVLMSAVFWCVQELGEDFNVEVTLPLKLSNVPDGVLITTELPDEVTLTVHGKGTDLLPLIINHTLDTLVINFRNYDNNQPTGRTIITLPQLQRMLNRPLLNDASLTSMAPDTLSFFYNRGLRKRLPVRFQGTMETSSQYSVAGHRFTPDSVDVYAPLTILDTMSAVYTSPIRLQQLSNSRQWKVGLQPHPGIKYMPDTVRMHVEVDVLTRQSVEVPIVGLNFPADKALRTFPSMVRINYLATIRQHETLDESLFVVAITYEELIRNSTGKCRPRLTNMPNGITGALIDPIEVDYLIENITAEAEDE